MTSAVRRPRRPDVAGERHGAGSAAPGRRLRGHAGDAGSILMLVPAGLLVVLVMASIAVDMSLVQLRQRQAHDLAAAAANDAATAALDPTDVRSTAATVDHARAVAVVDGIVRASDLAPHVVGSPVVRVEGGLVEVEITLQADYVFARAIPGTADGMTVRAAASAQAARP